MPIFRIALNHAGDPADGAWRLEVDGGPAGMFDEVFIDVPAWTVSEPDPRSGRTKGWILAAGALEVDGRVARIVADD